MYFVNFKRLLNSAGATITDLLLTSGVAVNSEAIKVDKNVGFLVLLIKENKAGGAGDVDIYAEYSDDATTWYRTYTTDLAGTITQEGNIVTTLQNVTRRIVVTARLAKYVRFVFDPDADSQITADVTFQEDE
jgi:hypothetical protein